MISFIIPAHNEEAWVGRCVSAIRSGLEALGEPHEIIVVDGFDVGIGKTVFERG